ncbi:glycosyltransferase [Salinicola aestuarinus]|uniref:glycosyltransferase n=1 Tax=Salinicola aestuarinus TaxID=1949082 RepID=UPI000DA268DB|nr:glycosyltransferase [Salinicola aestuarinus]
MLALPSLSILITVTDATHRVQSVVEEASRALRHARSLEFIVVDDATASLTAESLARLAESDSRVRVLRQSLPIGEDAALLRAGEVAANEWVATLDASGRDDPHDLPEMLCQARHHGLTLVHGKAMAPIGYRDRATHWVASLGRSGSSHHHGMDLVRRDALALMPDMTGLKRYLPLLVARRGWLMECHAANPRPGIQRPARALYRLPLEALITARDALGMAWFSRRLRPLTPQPAAARHPKRRAYAR